MKIRQFIAKLLVFNKMSHMNKHPINHNKIGNWIVDEDNGGFKWVDGHGKWILNRKTLMYEWIVDN